jgi:hypothetical protein
MGVLRKWRAQKNFGGNYFVVKKPFPQTNPLLLFTYDTFHGIALDRIASVSIGLHWASFALNSICLK